MQIIKKYAIQIGIVVIFLILGSIYLVQYNQTVTTLSKIGSRGEEVRQIQKLLKGYGVYNGSVDGIYGSNTAQAVRAFQRYNGLTVDGIAGPQTLKKMGIASNTNNTSNTNNINLLARLVYGEARGEPYTGQVAVAAVVLNRVKSSSFPNSIAGVIYQSGAFDAVSDGQINMTPNQTAINAATDAINGWDPSYGSIYYFNPSTATNKWIWSRPHTITIGKHRFCK